MSVRAMFLIPKEMYFNVINRFTNTQQAQLEEINVDQLNVSCGPLFAGLKTSGRVNKKKVTTKPPTKPTTENEKNVTITQPAQIKTVEKLQTPAPTNQANTTISSPLSTSNVVQTPEYKSQFASELQASASAIKSSTRPENTLVNDDFAMSTPIREKRLPPRSVGDSTPERISSHLRKDKGKKLVKRVAKNRDKRLLSTQPYPTSSTPRKQQQIPSVHVNDAIFDQTTVDAGNNTSLEGAAAWPLAKNIRANKQNLGAEDKIVLNVMNTYTKQPALGPFARQQRGNLAINPLSAEQTLNKSINEEHETRLKRSGNWAEIEEMRKSSKTNAEPLSVASLVANIKQSTGPIPSSSFYPKTAAADDKKAKPTGAIPKKGETKKKKTNSPPIRSPVVTREKTQKEKKEERDAKKKRAGLAPSPKKPRKSYKESTSSE